LYLFPGGFSRSNPEGSGFASNLNKPSGKRWFLCSKLLHKELRMSHLIHHYLSHRLLGIAIKVHNIIGCGLHETAYEEAFCIEFGNAGISYKLQEVYPIHYSGQYIGTYIADIVVENKFILEHKSVRALNPVIFAQLINYLKLSGLQVGYILNFHNTRVE
jgi:GxxExxY protein